MFIGLFFGSFNPVHTGHLMIANFLVESSSLDQVWFVVSPQNPLKKKQSLLNEFDRLHLVDLALEGNENLRSSNIEFSLPKPSYTVDTLTYLKEKYNYHQFALIMGMDNLATLDKWKNYEVLIKNHQIYVYPRPGYEFDESVYNSNNIHIIQDVPYLPISATFIRQNIKKGISMKYFVPDNALHYIEEMNLYK